MSKAEPSFIGTALRNLPLGRAVLAKRATGAALNGSFRDECLNETLFSSLSQARQQIAEWKEDYNSQRPHSSLGNITPNEFVMKMGLQKQAA